MSAENDSTVSDDGKHTTFQLGRIIGIMEVVRQELTEVKTRLVFRMDNLEARVETLEVGRAASGVYTEVVRKALWVVLGAVGAALTRLLFTHIGT